MSSFLKMTIFLSLVAVLTIIGGWTGAQAAPMFYQSSGPDPTGDDLFEAAVGTFVEENFEGFTNGQSFTSFTLGGVNITFTSGKPSTIFQSAVFGSPAGGGMPGTVFNKAVNVHDPLTFTFSVPIFGFGLWIFDDGTGTTSRFQMSANGGTSGPGPIDGNPGNTGYAVDGFLGVTDANLISSVVVDNIDDPFSARGYQFDSVHLAVNAPVAEPSTLLLLGIGLAGLGFVRRRTNG